MANAVTESHRKHFPQYRRSLRELRSNLWLSNLLWQYGLTIADLEYRIIPREADGATGTGLAYKWYRGKSIPTARSVAWLEEQLPNTKWVYDLPLHQILDPDRVRMPTLHHIFYETTSRRIDCTGNWFRIDNDVSTDLTRRAEDNEYYNMNIRRLVLWVTRARIAESRSNIDMFLHYFARAVLAFVMVGRIPWIYPHWKHLYRHVDFVRLGCPSLKLFFNVDVDTIAGLIEKPYLRISKWDIEAGPDSRTLGRQPSPFQIDKAQWDSMQLAFGD